MPGGQEGVFLLECAVHAWVLEAQQGGAWMLLLLWLLLLLLMCCCWW